MKGNGLASRRKREVPGGANEVQRVVLVVHIVGPGVGPGGGVDGLHAVNVLFKWVGQAGGEESCVAAQSCVAYLARVAVP